MKEEWLFPNAAVPVDTQTTLALLAEIKRLIDVVGGMALKGFEPDWADFANGREAGRAEAFEQIAEKVKAMPLETDTKDSFLIWLKEQA